MRKFIGMMIAFIACAFTTSCDQIKSQLQTQYDETELDQLVVRTVDSINNPVFYTAEDAVAYVVSSYETAYTDSVLNNVMDYKDIHNVATVLLKDCNSITKYDIVMEYIHNENVYKNLPEEPLTINESILEDLTSGTEDSTPDTVPHAYEEATNG